MKLIINGEAVEVSGGGGGGVPAGSIIIWSGSAADIPSGWALCDGQNGRPDLRDRFVLGGGGTHTIGDTGGEESHTLTVEEMPEHSHALPIGDAVGSGSFIISGKGAGYGSISSSSTGGSQPHNNMPPYYVLCYIIKVSSGGDSGGGSAGEVYSTEERRIGTWIDGKPLYRKVYQVTHEQKKDENETIPLDTDIDVDTLCAAYGSIRNKSFGSFYSFPYAEVYSGSNFADAFLISNSGDRAITLISHYWSNYTLEFFVTVEYTKTTDEAAVSEGEG